jgi:hypothetical protein
MTVLSNRLASASKADVGKVIDASERLQEHSPKISKVVGIELEIDCGCGV